MPDKPVTCQFEVDLEWEIYTLMVAVDLNVPVFVRLEMSVSSGDGLPEVVAVWSDGEWNVFEGGESSDPRHLLAMALSFGRMTSGPHGDDWLLVQQLLIKLTQATWVHYR
jgi:hypothetical protein